MLLILKNGEHADEYYEETLQPFWQGKNIEETFQSQQSFDVMVKKNCSSIGKY